MILTVAGRPAWCYTGGRAFDPALPAVVFIHGAQQDHSCWALQSRYLAHHGYGVLAPDLPGHARSPGPQLESVESLADWTAALLAAAGLERAVLVGHSMGSLVALATALRHPTRATALALVGTAVPMPVSEALLAATREDEERAMDMINIWSHGLFGGNAAPGLWAFGMNRRLMERVGRGTLAADMAACNAWQPAPGWQAGVRCPVLVVAGARDQMTPARAARQLVAELPGARIALIEACGHALMAEQPGALLDALRGFLQEVSAAR